ncbi:helix-turn-helix transcriptional regulator, partial [Marivirga sp.]|uniref:helix-turn-helix transcriptional regulator n=1 Tax=Marivirga sp. TaxID=2018662 RepID=UPI0025CF5168
PHFYQIKLMNAQLTFKEQEVLSLCKKGMNCQEISEKLFVTVETIKTHRKKIIKKLELHGKQEFRIFIMNLLEEELMLQQQNSPQNYPLG